MRHGEARHAILSIHDLLHREAVPGPEMNRDVVADGDTILMAERRHKLPLLRGRWRSDDAVHCCKTGMVRSPTHDLPDEVLISSDRGRSRKRLRPASKHFLVREGVQHRFNRAGEGYVISHRNQGTDATVIKDLGWTIRTVGADTRAAAGECLYQDIAQPFVSGR